MNIVINLYKPSYYYHCKQTVQNVYFFLQPHYTCALSFVDIFVEKKEANSAAELIRPGCYFYPQVIHS